MEDSETSFFSKGSYDANIKLTDKDEIIQNDEKIAETLNSFFINNEHKTIENPIEKIIVKYQFHPSI